MMWLVTLYVVMWFLTAVIGGWLDEGRVPENGRVTCRLSI